MYDETHVSPASFEKSIEALNTAEDYNYSKTFGISPYDNNHLESLEPNLEEFPYIWLNWVNRSIFEFFNKTYSEEMAKSSKENGSLSDFKINIAYALKVVPERNITLDCHFVNEVLDFI
jgi:hypothetical protein